MGLTEWQQHSAKIGGKGDGDESERDLRFAVNRFQKHQSKGQDSNQCHVVRQNHRTAERNQYQGNYQGSRAGYMLHQGMGDEFKQP